MSSAARNVFACSAVAACAAAAGYYWYRTIDWEAKKRLAWLIGGRDTLLVDDTIECATGCPDPNEEDNLSDTGDTSPEEGSMKPHPIHRPARIVAQAAAHVRAKRGLLKETPANRLLVDRDVRYYMKDRKMRPSHIAHFHPLAVELYFIPTDSDLMAVRLQKLPEVRSAKALLGGNGRK